MEPYKQTMESLFKVHQLESPMCKLEHIYTTCTQLMPRELAAFYEGSGYLPAHAQSLFIDSDTLQGLLIYVVSRMHYPQLWTELSLVEEFIPEGVLMSNRAYYLILLKASCEYLINLP
jgi:hypothetical protein